MWCSKKAAFKSKAIAMAADIGIRQRTQSKERTNQLIIQFFVEILITNNLI